MKRRKVDTSEVARRAPHPTWCWGRDSSDSGGIKNLWNKALVLPLVLGLSFFWFLAKQNQVSAQTANLVATVRINGLKVQVTAPSLVRVDRRFKVEATVRNLGGSKIKKTKAVISFSDSGLDLKGRSGRKLGVILEDGSKVASWRVTAKKAGSYVILVEASGIEEETGNLVEASETVMIRVKTRTNRSFWSLLRKFLARA